MDRGPYGSQSHKESDITVATQYAQLPCGNFRWDTEHFSLPLLSFYTFILI